MGKIVKQLGDIERHLRKNEIESIARDNAQAIIDCKKYDLLKVYIELKRYESYLSTLIQELKGPSLEKANEAGQKSFEYAHAQVNISSRTKWNFSVDQRWTELDHQIQELKQQKKAREAYLKEQNALKQIVDEETGEVIDNFELPKEIQRGLVIKL